MRIAIMVLISIIAVLTVICYSLLVMLGRKDKGNGTTEFTDKGDDLGEPSEIAQERKTQMGVCFPKVE